MLLFARGASAMVMSATFPGVSANATGLPRSSAKAWILLVPAARTANRFRELPLFEPAAERCALTWRLAMESSSGTGPAAAIFSKMRCQIRRWDQRLERRVRNLALAEAELERATRQREPDACATG